MRTRIRRRGKKEGRGEKRKTVEKIRGGKGRQQEKKEAGYER